MYKYFFTGLTTGVINIFLPFQDTNFVTSLFLNLLLFCSCYRCVCTFGLSSVIGTLLYIRTFVVYNQTLGDIQICSQLFHKCQTNLPVIQIVACLTYGNKITLKIIDLQICFRRIVNSQFVIDWSPVVQNVFCLITFSLGYCEI